MASESTRAATAWGSTPRRLRSNRVQSDSGNAPARVIRPALLAAGLAVLALAGVRVAGAAAQQPAEAAKGPPLNVAVFVSSRTDVCYDPGDVGAVTRLATAEQDRINRLGGIGGRPLALRFLDDRRSDDEAIAHVRTALADPQLLAMVGLSNSNRVQAVFKALGKQIGDSRIPFLTDTSVNTLIKPYPNVYTSRSSQEDERIPVTVAFLRNLGFERPAFAGIAGAVFATTLAEGVKKSLGAGALVADHRLIAKDNTLDPAAVRAMIADFKASIPDVLLLAIGTARTGEVMKEMKAAGVTPALFVTGRIDAIPADIANAWPNAIYQLAWDRLPDLDNDRLRKRIAKEDPQAWTFEGRKISQAPGWSKGECKPRTENGTPDPLDPANLRAIALGTQFADMVGLIAAAAKAAPPRADLATLRAEIVSQIGSAYAMGRGTFKGTFDNWSFDPVSRSASRTPFIVMLPQGLRRTQLAPVQYVRLRDGSLKAIDTLYADIDMIRAHRVDDNEKSFFAEFYLSMRNNPGAEIERIEFANAYLDPRTNGRQITVQVVHAGGQSAAYPAGMKIYKVTGRFIFEPELAAYPFDTQRFAIDLQPRRGDAPFIVQPPPASLRDRNVATDGWDPKLQYVGYDEDFVPVIDAYTHTPSVVPFYRATYVWQMKRQTTDYYLRVVVPLGFILIVAYLSVFIPLSHFEAIVTIQVTALLSAVALYLSLPKLDSDTATVSDRIFVVVYMLVSFMIALSIATVNRRVAHRPWLKRALTTLHIVAIPLLAFAMAYYVNAVAGAD